VPESDADAAVVFLPPGEWPVDPCREHFLEAVGGQVAEVDRPSRFECDVEAAQSANPDPTLLPPEGKSVAVL
jgi:hypothetical protein